MSDKERSVALRIASGVLGYAAEFISTEETRYYLNGVYVEPAKEGVRAVATDGQRLIVVHDPDGYILRPAILRAKPAVWSRLRSKHDATVTAADLGAKERAKPIMATLTPKKGEAEAFVLDEIDGTFPDWRKVIPADFPTGSVMPAFQGRYFAAFDGMARVGGHSGGVRVVARGVSEPAVVLPSSGSAWPWLGVVAPIRADDLPTAYPAWLGMEQKKVRVKAKTERRSA